MNSYDIYIEKDGFKAAVIRAYTAKLDDTGWYLLDLDHVYLSDQAITRGVDLSLMKNFDVVIRKFDKEIRYRACCWREYNHMWYDHACFTDKGAVMAKHRIETSIKDI